MYQLVFKGQCTPGVDISTARANVAQAFKANQGQLDRMFSGERVVIRNKLDSEAAAKYQAALSRQGIVVHIEAMAPRASEPAPAVRAQAPQQPLVDAAVPPPTTPAGPLVEPGERLQVAGERVDQLLSGSSLSLGRPGEILGQPRQVVAPSFDSLSQWSLAPAGERLVESKSQPAAKVPDLSHLDLVPLTEKS